MDWTEAAAAATVVALLLKFVVGMYELFLATLAGSRKQIQRTVSPEFELNESIWLFCCCCKNKAAFVVVLDPLELLERAKDGSILSTPLFHVMGIDISI